jgi:hypothetical protein
VRTTFAVWAILLWLIGPAFADVVQPDDHVQGHPVVTYFDLMRQVVTDLEADPQGSPTAHDIVPYRHIEGDKAKTDPAGPVAIQSLEALAIRADGQRRLALMADLGSSDEAVAGFVLLALFDTGQKPKLLDVVEVGRDRLTGFSGRPLRPLGHGTDLIQIESDHFNSDEDFVNTELVFVKNDRFRLLDSVFTFDVKSCTSVLAELPEVATRPDRSGSYNMVLLTVQETQKLQPGAADCDEKPPRRFVRRFYTTYRWDARRGRFAAVSGNMKKLDAENDRLMNRP